MIAYHDPGTLAVRKADDFFWNRRGPIHFGVTEKFLRCMHACLRAPCMRCSYHSGHRACMRMTSIASRTYLCDPTTVVSQRDCSSPSGTLAVRRVDDSLWNRRGQIRSDVTEKFGSACTMHALLVPFCQACVQAPRMRVHACARTLHGRSPHHFWRACVHAPRMRRHTHIPFCPARA